jgi:hypothetical protein
VDFAHSEKNGIKNVFELIQTGSSFNIKQQLTVYIDKNGLLRYKGRLENINLSETARYPYLLPENDHVTRLNIERVNKKQLHSGLTQTLSELRYKY